MKAQLLVREMNTKVVAFYEYLGYEVAPRTVIRKWENSLGRRHRSTMRVLTIRTSDLYLLP